MKEQIAWPSLQPCPPPFTRKPKACSETDENVKWKRAAGDYKPSTGPINRLARDELTTISRVSDQNDVSLLYIMLEIHHSGREPSIFRLRTGHCGLRGHLKRIGIMDSALCDCKEAEQTVHRILQDCPIWRKQRHQLWPQDEPTTNKLWRTAEDLGRTTQFLATCGLRV